MQQRSFDTCAAGRDGPKRCVSDPCVALEAYTLACQHEWPPVTATRPRTSSKERPGSVVRRLSSLEELVDVPDEVRKVSVATYYPIMQCRSGNRTGMHSRPNLGSVGHRCRCWLNTHRCSAERTHKRSPRRRHEQRNPSRRLRAQTSKRVTNREAAATTIRKALGYFLVAQGLDSQICPSSMLRGTL